MPAPVVFGTGDRAGCSINALCNKRAPFSLACLRVLLGIPILIIILLYVFHVI